ncbi:Transcriptional repressor SmtB [Rubrobacter xylanophilus DSM 9941]|uniref:ArsR/SmtB family transcription factor n=1 Tax=Rubrobacter xylanophilus TaxID=49319 RepID=UPI001C640F6B|nr:metalloregulator ArsR/SmtB family transcription factor [Rubrobacter xylanophilus]QYJ16794.1 Transcriptional repressor SmtB [Rubrobacter xylanophilus DSM 9941]
MSSDTRQAERFSTCEETGIHPREVSEALSAMPEPEEIRGASELLKAVGDPTRMRILCALADRELCVCDLQAVLGLSQSAVSHQLRTLRNANLVTYRREGKMAYYTLADDHVRRLLDLSLRHVRHT